MFRQYAIQCPGSPPTYLPTEPRLTGVCRPHPVPRIFVRRCMRAPRGRRVASRVLLVDRDLYWLLLRFFPRVFPPGFIHLACLGVMGAGDD